MNTQAITSLMSSADLDVWADIYAQAKIGELVTVPLSQFLLDPWTHLSGAGQESSTASTPVTAHCFPPKFVPAKQSMLSGLIRIAALQPRSAPTSVSYPPSSN